MKKIPKLTASEVERFESKLEAVGDCLVYTGARKSSGYGVFHLRKRMVAAHRVAYRLHTGRDPGKLNVCHHCDNPACCKPEHLFLGTQADNVQDCINKGRDHKARVSGSKNHAAKLTEKDVRAIRRSKLTGKQLAIKYGVSDMIISLVRRRLRWQHVK